MFQLILLWLYKKYILWRYRDNINALMSTPDNIRHFRLMTMGFVYSQDEGKQIYSRSDGVEIKFERNSAKQPAEAR